MNFLGYWRTLNGECAGERARDCECEAPIDTEVGGKVLSKRAEKIRPVYQTLDWMRAETFADRANCFFSHTSKLNSENQLGIPRHFPSLYSYVWVLLVLILVLSFFVTFFFLLRCPSHSTHTQSPSIACSLLKLFCFCLALNEMSLSK